MFSDLLMPDAFASSIVVNYLKQMQITIVVASNVAIAENKEPKEKELGDEQIYIKLYMYPLCCL